MKTISIAVCDDDKMALTVIAGAVRSAFENRGVKPYIKMYTGVAQLREEMEEEGFQLLMLDITMPVMDGIQFGRLLRNQGNKVDIIFVSNCENRVFESFEVNPFGFVRKANFLKDMSQVVDRYIESKRQEGPSQAIDLPTRSSGRLHVPVEDILCFEGSGMYQILTFRSGKQEQIASRMDNLEKSLQNYGFLRIHKGYLVNYRYITRLDKTEATLIDGRRVPISRRKSRDIHQQYLRLGKDLGVLLF